MSYFIEKVAGNTTQKSLRILSGMFQIIEELVQGVDLGDDFWKEGWTAARYRIPASDCCVMHIPWGGIHRIL